MGFDDPLVAAAFDVAAMRIGEEVGDSAVKRGAFPVVQVG